MLEYYQIDMSGKRDEKLSTRDQKKFLDEFNQNYDTYAIQDILSKIKDKFKQNKPFEEEESDDPFFDKLKNETEDEDKQPPFPMDLNSRSGRRIGIDDWKSSLNINPDIENFINWLSDLLYSADHKVIIKESEDGQITNIELHKIKKKRGGKKK
jgi:hypothetical protein